MEGGSPSNGGLLYHEVQESKLCAVHCVNTVLQGPFFSELDLAALASDLDQRERQMMMMMEADGPAAATVGDFLSEDSHNVSMGGDFSIQVLEKALEVWDLHVIPLDSPVAEPTKHDPEMENAYICHLQDHWFCIRKVNGEWYNFNSLYAAPEHLTKFYLSAYLDSLKSGGWSIFLVRGNFPKECPISSSEASNGFGQWLTPDDAERITKSCNQKRVAGQRVDTQKPLYPVDYAGDIDEIMEQEEADLIAAIEASLVDSAAYDADDGMTVYKNCQKDSPVVGSASASPLYSSFSVDSAVGTESKKCEGSHGETYPHRELGQQSVLATSKWALKPCNQKEAAESDCRSITSVPSSPAQPANIEDAITEEEGTRQVHAAIQASLMGSAACSSSSCTKQNEINCKYSGGADAEAGERGSESSVGVCTEGKELQASGATEFVDSESLSGDLKRQ